MLAASAMVLSICGATAERRTYTTASQTSMGSVESGGDTTISQASSQNNLTFSGWDNKAISILQQVLKMGQESTYTGMFAFLTNNHIVALLFSDIHTNFSFFWNHTCGCCTSYMRKWHC